MMKKIARKLILFYQRYLTVISFGSCRYYPSCSEYAIQQFEKNTILVALYQSALRILRCNQLFIGGIDYPIMPCKKLLLKERLVWQKVDVKFWLVPKDEKYCYIIKAFK